MRISTAASNPVSTDHTMGLIVFYCGSESDEEGTVAVGRTILKHMAYKGEPRGDNDST